MDIHWHLCSSTRVPAKRLLPLLWKCQPSAGKRNMSLSNMGRSTIKHHVGGGGRGGGGGGGGGFLAEAPGGWADRIWRSALSALAFPAVPVLHCWGLLALDKLLSEGLAEIAVIGSFGASKSDGKQKHGRMEATLISSAFHSLIWLNDAEAQSKLSLDTDLTQTSTIRPETLQPVAFNFLSCVAKQHLNWCLFSHMYWTSAVFFFFFNNTNHSVTSSLATSDSNYCILELNELPSPD